MSASRFEIVSVTQSSVKTAPQAKKIDAVCGFLKDFYVMKNVMSLSPKARDFFVNFPYRNQCFLGFGQFTLLFTFTLHFPPSVCPRSQPDATNIDRSVCALMYTL